MPKQSRKVNNLQTLLLGALLVASLAFFLWLLTAAQLAGVTLFIAWLMPMVGVICLLYVARLAWVGLRMVVWWD